MEALKHFTLEKQFFTYLKSAVPVMLMQTVEVERAVRELKGQVTKFNTEVLPKSSVTASLKTKGFSMYTWDVNKGFMQEGVADAIKNTVEPVEALRWSLLDEKAGPGVYIMENMHFFWQDQLAFPIVLQLIREFYAMGAVNHKHLVLVGAGGEIPMELQPYTLALDYPLPNLDSMQDVIKESAAGIGLKLKKQEVYDAARATQGMTAMEVAGAICVSDTLTEGKGVDVDVLFAEKAKAVKRTGLLEHIESAAGMEEVGGLDNVKDWADGIEHVFSNPEKAEAYNMPLSKGALVAGISGTGKSLIAKAMASKLGVSLYRCDVGTVFGGIVGDTERNTRELFKTIDGVAPCVILIDECEKALSGLKSSDSSDAGVTARFFGALLTYMQEKTSQSFFVLTANDVSKLPPELMRKGRIDELWFVDLPSVEEREEIFNIHLKKVGRKPEKFEVKALAEESEGYTGAEIESVIGESMRIAFRDKFREFTSADIRKAMETVVTLKATKAKEIADLKAWAKGRARPASSFQVDDPTPLMKKEGGRSTIK